MVAKHIIKSSESGMYVPGMGCDSHVKTIFLTDQSGMIICLGKNANKKKSHSYRNDSAIKLSTEFFMYNF